MIATDDTKLPRRSKAAPRVPYEIFTKNFYGRASTCATLVVAAIRAKYQPVSIASARVVFLFILASQPCETVSNVDATRKDDKLSHLKLITQVRYILLNKAPPVLQAVRAPLPYSIWSSSIKDGPLASVIVPKVLGLLY